MNYFPMGLMTTLQGHPVMFIKDVGAPKKKRPGRTPDIMRKGGPMKDRSKYSRKPKHKRRDHGPESNHH